jgi:hypothetical protein
MHYLLFLSIQFKMLPVCFGYYRYSSFFPRNFRSSPPFTATCKNSTSARCVSAANLLCKDVNIFSKTISFLKQILR